jgi:predicted nuclease with TOPRIM domain
MEIKVIPASQFENQCRVNGLKTLREGNQDKINLLRERMSKIKREISDYVAANNELTREIEELEAQISAAVQDQG